MYVLWDWIKNQLLIPDNYSLQNLVNQLNYFGLECDISIWKDQILFLNFVTAHNRKDLKSWWGILREISILSGFKILNFQNFDKENKNYNLNTKKIIVESLTNDVIEYNVSIIKINNDIINNTNAPKWIIDSLIKNGIKSINLIVDIGNFVMLETGQPVHIFDFDKLGFNKENKKITIKNISENTSFFDTYGQKRELFAGDAVVFCSEKIIDLVGIIGEKNTSISNDTKNIMIESAYFNNLTIKRTSDRINLKTRASENFIKKFNQESSKNALFRTVELINIFCCGKNENKENFEFFFYNSKEKKNTERKIKVEHEYLEKKIGIKITKEKISKCFFQLFFDFEIQNNNYIIEIPSYRTDISIKEDIVEELGKILDYNLLHGKLPVLNNQFIDHEFNFKLNLKRKISNFLLSSGYSEIISYSLVEQNRYNENESFIKLSFPKSSNFSIYRKSLIQSHLEVVKNNLRQGNDNIFLFEISNVYEIKDQNVFEKEILSTIGVGKIINFPVHSFKEEYNFYWLKGLIENIFSIIGINYFSFSNDRNFSINLEKNQSFEIFIDNLNVGFFGKINKNVLIEKNIKNNDLFIIELMIEKILDYCWKMSESKYKSVSNLPVIKKDISFFVSKKVNIESLTSVINQEGGKFLIKSCLFDVFEKEELSSNQHSLAFRLFFQGRNDNLQNKDIEIKIIDIIKRLKSEFSISER